MKKLLLSLFFVFGLGTSLHAEPAAPPYAWNIYYVGSEQYGYYEYTVGKNTTTEDHGGYIHFYVVVDGGYCYRTSVTWDGSVMTPFRTTPLDMNGDTITDRWVMEFEKSYATEGSIQVKDYSTPASAYKTVQDYLYVR